MKDRETKRGEASEISMKLRVVRIIQDLYLETDAYWQLPEIFMMILRSLDDMLGFKHSMIYLLNEDGQTLTFQSCWGYSNGHIGAPVKVGQGFIGMAAESGEVMRFGDLGKGFRYMKAIQNRTEVLLSKDHGENPRAMPGMAFPESHMSVPLKSKSEVIGVIAVESKQAGAFDEIDQELLLLIAGQTARLIEEVRRNEVNRRRQEGLLHAKRNLDQLNRFLDSVISASSMEDTSTYTAAITKQMKGFHYIESDTDRARAFFEHAADLFCEIGMLLEMVKSKLGAAVLVYHDRPEHAHQLLQECMNGFQSCGAESYVELTKSLIARLEPADKGLQQLTRREREVAVLVSQGYSNSEIAEKLVLSVRTITTHIERIYSKLGLQSRTELSRYIIKNT
jgi:DNA-binding CsgD family transcriptional regulator